MWLWGQGQGGLDEGGKKVQTSSYKINTRDDVQMINRTLLLYVICEIVKRVNLEFSSQGKKFVFISI